MARVSTLRAGSSGTTTGQDKAGEMIRKKAYELFEKRGKKSGHAMDDWLEAERIVKQRAF